MRLRSPPSSPANTNCPSASWPTLNTGRLANMPDGVWISGLEIGSSCFTTLAPSRPHTRRSAEKGVGSRDQSATPYSLLPIPSKVARSGTKNFNRDLASQCLVGDAIRAGQAENDTPGPVDPRHEKVQVAGTAASNGGVLQGNIKDTEHLVRLGIDRLYLRCQVSLPVFQLDADDIDTGVQGQPQLGFRRGWHLPVRVREELHKPDTELPRGHPNLPSEVDAFSGQLVGEGCPKAVFASGQGTGDLQCDIKPARAPA